MADLKCPIEQAVTIKYVVTNDISKGEFLHINGLVGFSIRSYKAGEEGVFVVYAPDVEVDVENGNYNAGESLYIDNANYLLPLNKTSAGRTKIAKVKHPGSGTRIRAIFTGTLNT
jgi:hypothetical protein